MGQYGSKQNIPNWHITEKELQTAILNLKPIRKAVTDEIAMAEPIETAEKTFEEKKFLFDPTESKKAHFLELNDVENQEEIEPLLEEKFEDFLEEEESKESLTLNDSDDSSDTDDSKSSEIEQNAYDYYTSNKRIHICSYYCECETNSNIKLDI